MSTEIEVSNGNGDLNGNGTHTNEETNGVEDSGANETALVDNSQSNGENKPVQKKEKLDKSKLEPEYYRKVFVGSLSYSTTDEGLRTYFSKYGELVDSVIMKESKSNKSRGFGFVTYMNSTMVDELMKHRPHKLDGRELETKRATPREETGKPGSEMTTKKLFVGAVKDGLTEDHLKEHFGKYGKIQDCIIMKDKDGKIRGFGFVTFDDYDPVDKIVLEKFHTVNGQSLAVKKALPKEQDDGGRRGGSGGGGRSKSGNSRAGNSSSSNKRFQSNSFNNRFNNNDYDDDNDDFDDDFDNGNDFGNGGGFNNFGGGGNNGMANINFALLAQKMLQAATMPNNNNNNFGGFGSGMNPLASLGMGSMGSGSGANSRGGNRRSGGSNGLMSMMGSSGNNGGPIRANNSRNGGGNRGGSRSGPYGGGRSGRN